MGSSVCIVAAVPARGRLGTGYSGGGLRIPIGELGAAKSRSSVGETEGPNDVGETLSAEDILVN